MSIEDKIAAELATRLAQITIANGYQTDIGLRIFDGRRNLDETHMPCVVMLEDDDDPAGMQAPNGKTSLPWLIEGHTVCDPDHPNIAARKIVSDLKKAVFSGDLTFGDKRAIACRYDGRSISPRQDGLSLVSANIVIVIDVVENLSAPEI
jgi:hypothetical protein